MPSDIAKFVEKVREKYDQGNELLRIYYYDCQPSDAQTVLPVSKAPLSYKNSPLYRDRMQFLAALKRADFVAVREGRLYFRGWTLKDEKNPPAGPLTDADYVPDFEQKGVDIKIGLDIAWIGLGKIAERIYLVTGDSDFIAAMKFARRSGVQVFLFTFAHGVVNELKDHADVLDERPIKDVLA